MTNHQMAAPEHHRLMGTFFVLAAIVALFFAAMLLYATVVQAGSLFN